MSLDRKLVEQVAHLARLEIPETDVEAIGRELANILEFVDQMNTADTTGIEPMAHPMDACQRLRPDRVTETDRREALQSCATVTRDGLYIVPRVIE